MLLLAQQLGGVAAHLRAILAAGRGEVPVAGALEVSPGVKDRYVFWRFGCGTIRCFWRGLGVGRATNSPGERFDRIELAVDGAIVSVLLHNPRSERDKISHSPAETRRWAMPML